MIFYINYFIYKENKKLMLKKFEKFKINEGGKPTFVTTLDIKGGENILELKMDYQPTLHEYINKINSDKSGLIVWCKKAKLIFLFTYKHSGKYTEEEFEKEFFPVKKLKEKYKITDKKVIELVEEYFDPQFDIEVYLSEPEDKL